MLARIFWSIKTIFTDWRVFLLSLLPFSIGAFIYVYFGHLIFTIFQSYLQGLVTTWIGQGYFASVFNALIVFILTILTVLFVGWTFTFCLSVIATPFNLFLGKVLFKKLHPLEKIADEGSLWDTVKGEIKKFILIILMTLIGFLSSFIPFGFLISIPVSSFLVIFNFSDYFWSAENLNTSKSLKRIKENFLTFMFSGVIFFLVLAIPLVNVFFHSLAVIYFAKVNSEMKLKEVPNNG